MCTQVGQPRRKKQKTMTVKNVKKFKNLLSTQKLMAKKLETALNQKNAGTIQ